jgi:hypothetical protein
MADISNLFVGGSRVVAGSHVSCTPSPMEYRLGSTEVRGDMIVHGALHGQTIYKIHRELDDLKKEFMVLREAFVQRELELKTAAVTARIISSC